MIIFLIGYMACGKTTLGRALASVKVVDFVDLDEYIHRHTGMSPSQWFSDHGENAFRIAEYRALQAVCAEVDSRSTESPLPLVVACGGGTSCNADALGLMLERGTVVWLEASEERTIARILDAASGSRPLVADKDADELRRFIPAHYESRKPYYSRAHLRFDSSRLDTPEEIADTVDRFIKLLL